MDEPRSIDCFSSWSSEVEKGVPETSHVREVEIRRSRLEMFLPPRSAILIAGAAGIFFAFDLAAWHIGILQTKVANATLFGNCASLLLVIWGIFLTRTLPRGWQALAIGLAFAGSALLMGQSYELSPDYLVGDLLSLLRLRRFAESEAAAATSGALLAIAALHRAGIVHLDERERVSNP